MSLAAARPVVRVAEIVATVNGETLILDATGALYWERMATLVVSDLHLEKGSSLAARGVLLPPYDSQATLARVAMAVRRFAPRRVIALGDSFHDEAGPERLDGAARAALHALQRDRDWLWIEGNHDRGACTRLPGDHASRLSEDGLTFTHIAAADAGPGELSGHYHPVAKVVGAGRAVRAPAFVTDGKRMILPAIGAFTGGLNARDGAIERLFPGGFAAYACRGTRISKLSWLVCRPD